jgi:alkane 1-monooxygenase
MGESIYKFSLREIPGAFFEAWSLEKDRLARRGKSVWSTNNQILHSFALSALLTIGLIAVFGWIVLPFIVLHNAFAWWQLTSANYVEHYGLLRQKDSAGKYERCQPHHSWNSNHIYSNLVLLHLERHSDHHSHPTRRYQSLRHYDNLPSLPTGYFGAYLLAYVPKFWFRVMDKRLLALPQVRGDLDLVNVDPAARPALFLEYGRDKMNEPTIVL